MIITHRELMRLRSNPGTPGRNAMKDAMNPDCAGVCAPVYSGLLWTLYRCTTCQARIAAYGGQPHEWNYALKGRSS